VSTLGLQNGENWEFSAHQFLRGKYEHPIGHNQFQNIPGRVAVSRKSVRRCRKICGREKEK